MRTILIILLSLFVHQACTKEKVDYNNLKTNIKICQKQFNEKYQHADTPKKKEIIRQAENYLIKVISDSIFNCWYGTPWNFNGTTQIPKKGSIACGYFITVVLQDAGFNIPRIKWAQSASEEVIKKIGTDVKRFRSQPVEKVTDYIIEKGDGLYIVGLDCHVGFILKSGNEIKFIHSSYYRPKTGVLSESLKGWNPLNDSKYRVIGKLLGQNMTENWIKGTRYE